MHSKQFFVWTKVWTVFLVIFQVISPLLLALASYAPVLAEEPTDNTIVEVTPIEETPTPTLSPIPTPTPTDQSALMTQGLRSTLNPSEVSMEIDVSTLSESGTKRSCPTTSSESSSRASSTQHHA